METLANLGMFLGGVGFLLLGCGLMWFISVWSEKNKEK
jgi:hypothetical protein